MTCAVEARDVFRMLIKYVARVGIKNDQGYSSKNVCDYSHEYFKELLDTVKRVTFSLKSLSLRRLRLE
jgi:hypothetical protein